MPKKYERLLTIVAFVKRNISMSICRCKSYCFDGVNLNIPRTLASGDTIDCSINKELDTITGTIYAYSLVEECFAVIIPGPLGGGCESTEGRIYGRYYIEHYDIYLEKFTYINYVLVKRHVLYNIDKSQLMIYQENVTIAITSCGRFDLLKQTIDTLSLSINLSSYPKIMTEDSKDKQHIARIKRANEDGFLQGWTILYTGGSGQNDVLQSHYYALQTLYDNIHTKYTFHCEDDQIFYKTDFDYIKLSYDILENNKNIVIVTLRDLYKDYGIRKEGMMRSRYYDILTDDEEEFYGHVFIYGNSNSIFNLQPGLRRTDIVKKAMFGFEKTINETFVSQRLSEQGYKGIYIRAGLYYNPDRRWNSTRNMKSMGFKKYIIEALSNAIKYRIGLTIKYCKYLFSTIINHGE